MDTNSMDAPTCVAVPGNQRARWRANNSTNDHGGTFNGVQVGGLGYTPGKYDSAFLFDGVDDAVTIDDGELLWPSASFSLEAWVKKNSQTASGAIINKYACADLCPSGNATADMSLAVDGNGAPSFSFRPDSTNAHTVLSATLVNVADGQWHHIVGVRDNAAMTASLYVDGALAVSVTPAAAQFDAMTNMDNNLDPVTIGAVYTGGTKTLTYFFPGAIDEVAVYHSALSAADVAAIYNAAEGKCP